MNQLSQSIGLWVALVVLIVLGMFNAVQMNRLQSELIRTNMALEQIASKGITVSGAAQNSSEASNSSTSLAVSDEEQAAINDPDNLLQPKRRKWVKSANAIKGGTLRVKFGQDPRGLNQYIANGADVDWLSRWFSSYMAGRDIEDPGYRYPLTVLKVIPSEDELSYTIHLRPGVLWHEPNVDWESGRYEWLRGDHELTSDDYRFVYEILKNPQAAGRVSAMRTYFESMSDLEVIDKYTFKVIYSEKLATNLPQLLDLTPMPRWIYQYDEDGNKYDDATWGLKLNEHWYNRKAIGVGPYRLMEWEPGVKIEFIRNERYFGETPSFDRIVVFILKDQAAWVRKLKTGEMDITQIQPEQYRTEVLDATGPYLNNERIKSTKHNTLGYFYLGWNGDHPLFTDKLVRQAMTMALNREGIIENVFHGLGTLTTGPFAQQTDCYDKSIEPWPYDLEKASAKLDEAGWKDLDGDGIREKRIDGELVSFDFPMLIYGSSTEYETIASIYREDLLSIGVRMTPQALEWSTLLKKMDEKQFAVYTGAWVLSWEVDLYQLWHSSEADRPRSSNRIGFRNAEADKIAETLRRETDNHERTKLCRAFHKLVHEEQPYTFIYQRKRPVLYWDWMTDPEFSPVSPYRDYRFWSFQEDRP